MIERGLHVDHTTIDRCMHHYAPELEKPGPPHLKATNDSWRVDETSIKVKKVWMHLYRAEDPQVNTLEFILNPHELLKRPDASSRERLMRRRSG